jgi:hypothetical protein
VRRVSFAWVPARFAEGGERFSGPEERCGTAAQAAARASRPRREKRGGRCVQFGAPSPRRQRTRRSRAFRDCTQLIPRRPRRFDRRKLYRELGHASLFSFLRVELKLSAGAAQYRNAELTQRFPEVEAALRDGRLCLSSVIEVAKVLTPENRTEVLPRFLGLSSRDAAFVAASIRPVENARGGRCSFRSDRSPAPCRLRRRCSRFGRPKWRPSRLLRLRPVLRSRSRPRPSRCGPRLRISLPVCRSRRPATTATASTSAFASTGGRRTGLT